MYKKYGIFGLFLLLVVILVIKPRVIFNLYNNILGRVVLIGVVLFFTISNITLGLLAALCLIIVSNMFFMEGMDNLNSMDKSMIQSGLTIGDDNAVSPSGTQIQVTTKDQIKTKVEAKDGSTISELQSQAAAQGVDRQTVQETIQAKSSKTIPVDKSNFKSDDVSPNEPTTSATTEGFYNKYAKF